MAAHEPHGTRSIGRAVRRGLIAAAASGVCLGVTAHEPIARCQAPDATTIRCQGGHAGGEGAPGATLDVIGLDGRTLVAGKLGADSTFTFARPRVGFYVLFDVGPGHQVVIEQDEIRPVGATRP